MENRFKFVIFAFLYLGTTILSTPTVALAAQHKHHHPVSEHRHRMVANPRHVGSPRLSVAARRHRDRVLARSHKSVRRQPVVLTRSERRHLRIRQRTEQVATRRDLAIARALHVHILREIIQITRQEHIQHVEAYKAHLASVEADRRERLAEMRGDISSKSIRAWQAYILSVPIRLISVDLNDPTVKVSGLLAQNGIGSAESFTKMIRRSQPDVAVTGTFFSLDNLKPVGDIVINGDLAYFGGMGTALCITRDNRAEMVTVPWGHHHDWSNYDFVMACGPRLLEDHEIVLDPQSERFRDQHMLAPNSRIGVGITASNKLVFVMTQKPIYLGRLAKIMQALGCSQAMNLDAGTSTGFYYEGNMMASPGRWLTNAIVVYANQRPT